MTVAVVVNLVSAGFALAAAIVWFLSAANKLPPIPNYYGKNPDDDPFFLAIKRGVKLNRWAAALSGGTALFMALGVLCGLCPW